MDDSLLRRWTRRGLGLLCVVVTLPGLRPERQTAKAGKRKGKKKKKKRANCYTTNCVLLGNACNPFGSPCCDCNRCVQVNEIFACVV